MYPFLHVDQLFPFTYDGLQTFAHEFAEVAREALGGSCTENNLSPLVFTGASRWYTDGVLLLAALGRHFQDHSEWCLHLPRVFLQGSTHKPVSMCAN